MQAQRYEAKPATVQAYQVEDDTPVTNLMGEAIPAQVGDYVVMDETTGQVYVVEANVFEAGYRSVGSVTVHEDTPDVDSPDLAGLAQAHATGETTIPTEAQVPPSFPPTHTTTGPVAGATSPWQPRQPN